MFFDILRLLLMHSWNDLFHCKNANSAVIFISTGGLEKAGKKLRSEVKIQIEKKWILNLLDFKGKGQGGAGRGGEGWGGTGGGAGGRANTPLTEKANWR